MTASVKVASFLNPELTAPRPTRAPHSPASSADTACRLEDRQHCVEHHVQDASHATPGGAFRAHRGQESKSPALAASTLSGSAEAGTNGEAERDAQPDVTHQLAHNHSDDYPDADPRAHRLTAAHFHVQRLPRHTVRGGRGGSLGGHTPQASLARTKTAKRNASEGVIPAESFKSVRANSVKGNSSCRNSMTQAQSACSLSVDDAVVAEGGCGLSGVQP